MTQRTAAPPVVSFPYHALRNISAPEDLENGRKVLVGQAPITSILGLPTDENVRDYLLEAEGRKRRQETQVHKKIRETLENNPENFSVLNGGVVIIARDYDVDEKERVVRLHKPSIINGSQTQGVVKDFLEARRGTGQDVPRIHVKFELIITEDDNLVAETSIARNFQNDVMTISIAGRLGQLDELEEALQRHRPASRLQKSESVIARTLSLDEDIVRTEKLIQVMTALTPEELWYQSGDAGNPNKSYTYSAKTKCLKDFQNVHTKAHDPADKEYTRYRELYQFYLDIAPYALELYHKWRTHQGFIGTGLRSIKRDETGRKVEEVPDGIVFPILAALSAFATKTPDGWRIVPPAQLRDEELIQNAKTAYQELAASNPNTMGKSKACYSNLYQITSIYRRLLSSTVAHRADVQLSH